MNRLIRIMSKEGYFGFAEPLEFHSVVELVDYYRENSLQPYSPKLDITLREPVSKSEVASSAGLRNDQVQLNILFQARIEVFKKFCWLTHNFFRFL